MSHLNELDKLKTSVLEQAEQKGQEFYKRETNKLEKEFNQKIEESLRKQTESKEIQQKRIKQAHDGAIQQIANRNRQMALISKENMMKELFNASLIKMNDWSADEEIDFIEKILNKYSQASLTLTFGDKTYNKLTPDMINKLGNNFPTISIADQTIPRESGFILSNDKVDYNYLYAKLMDYIQAEVGMKIIGDIIKTDEIV